MLKNLSCRAQLRLNQEQRQQKEAAEAAIADLQDQESLEADADAKAELQKQIADGKAGLDDLMEAFAVSAWQMPHVFLCVYQGRAGSLHGLLNAGSACRRCRLDCCAEINPGRRGQGRYSTAQ